MAVDSFLQRESIVIKLEGSIAHREIRQEAQKSAAYFYRPRPSIRPVEFYYQPRSSYFSISLHRLSYSFISASFRGDPYTPFQE